MKTIRYKVVAQIGKCLYSYSSSIMVEYAIGKTSESEIGGLLVFKDLKSAQDFLIAQFTTTKIFECECYEPVELPKFKAYAFASTDQIKKVWKGYYSLFKPNFLSNWPAGTEAYKKVKLIKEVKL